MRPEGAAPFLRELYRWNKSINLTSVRPDDAEEVLVKPSLAMVEFFPRGEIRVFDIGSGGGIPAVVLALCLPDAQFFLVESDRKKSVFLVHVADLLGLKNVRVLNERAERLAKTPEFAGTGEIVTSRAVKREAVFNAACGLLKPAGLAIIHRSSGEIPNDSRFLPVGSNAFADCFRRA